MPKPVMPAAGHAEWWRGATIYQIYPRSFLDSNGDGIGDLAGIMARLDHVARLGVDAIWISPFFTSPMADFGYDVADYRDVAPIFGTLADFDVLVERAHSLGLKVTIDLVFAHTSDQHDWFMASRASHSNPRADWYVWANPKPDGTPPNNWQSVFGGPAWTWDARRRQYYLHQFLKEQPQLNVHNPIVQEALLDVVRFWLDRGVDGFRFDALNHAMFDPLLRDNPPARGHEDQRSRPFDWQRKTRSQNHPDIIDFIERIRVLCDTYGSVFSVAEIGGDDAKRLMKAYCAGRQRLSSAYSFAFLYAKRLTPALVRKVLGPWTGTPPHNSLDDGWPSWAFDNHDAPRSITRWCGKNASRETMDRFAKMEIALLASLRGNIFLYQGQELGLEQDVIPFAQLKDPEAMANWPLTLGRDGVRTPIPWTSGPHGGFTSGEPWLPLSQANLERCVDLQNQDTSSVLHWTIHVLTLRQLSQALRLGEVTNIIAKGNLLLLERRWQAGLSFEHITCAFNLGTRDMALSAIDGEIILATDGARQNLLPAFGAIWLRHHTLSAMR